MRSFLAVSLMSMLIVTSSDAVAYNQSWESIPLTTTDQKLAGIPGGEGMQMVFGISYAPSNPNVVYMVTDTSQVWKSTDGGKSWKFKNKGYLSNGGISIAIDPLNENIIFAAGSQAESSEKSSPADGIYLSINGGDKWTLVKKSSFFRGREGQHFIFSGVDKKNNRSKTVYVGTHQDGLLKSEDGGKNWEALGLMGIRVYDVKKWRDNPFVILMATENGLIFWDEKSGEFQNAEARGFPKTDLPITNFALDANNLNIVYIAARKAGLYKTDTGGKNFYRSGFELPIGVDYAQISSCSSNGKTRLYLSADNYGGLNPFWSDDGGQYWHTPTTIDSSGVSLTKKRYFSAQVTINPNKCEEAITSANGYDRVIRTINGGKTWEYSGSGFTGGRAGVGRSSFSFGDNLETVLLFLIDFGPALSTDGGKTFSLLNVPRRGVTTTPVGDMTGQTIVSAVGHWGHQALIISNDLGKSWKVVPDTEDDYRFISLHPQNKNIIYAQRYVSSDKGKNWDKRTYPIRAFYPANGDVVYSFAPGRVKGTTILISSDQGLKWTEPYPALPVYTKEINEIAVSPTDRNRIYVASNDGLYILDNEKWVKPGENHGIKKDAFNLNSIRSVVIDPKYPNIVYIGKWAPGKGHSNGIFRSMDFGKTWTNITYNLGPEFTAWALAVNPYDRSVYVGSSLGTWHLSAP